MLPLTGRPGGPAGPMGPVPPDIPWNQQQTTHQNCPHHQHCPHNQTYSLSLWSAGPMRSGQTSVSFLSLLSRRSNKAKKTWMSLLSFCTRVSSQTQQTRWSLKKRPRGRPEFNLENCKGTIFPEMTTTLRSYNRSRWSLWSGEAGRSLLTLK